MPVIQAVPFLLDKPRHLLYTWAAFMKAENELTKAKGRPTTALEVFKTLASVMEMSPEGAEENERVIDFSKISITDLLILLWAGLLHEDPKLSIERVGENLTFGDFSRALSAVVEAISNSIPSEESSPPPLEVQQTML